MQNNCNCKQHQGIQVQQEGSQLCPNCQTEQNDQTQAFFKWFNDAYDSEHKKKIDQLKYWIQKLCYLKNILNNELDKSINCLFEQIKTIEQQRNQHKCELSFQTYISETNHLLNTQQKTFKIKIEEQLSQIELKSFIDDLFQELTQLEDYQVQFNPDVLVQVQENQEKIQIDILCDEDDEVISMIDINQDRPRNKRLACPSCIDTDKYVSLNEAHQLWKNFEEQKKTLFRNYLNTTEIKIDLIKSNFEQAKSSFTSIIDNAVIFLNDWLQGVSLNFLQKQSEISKDWSTLSKKNIIDIAEQLSNQTQIKNEINENFKNSIEYVNQVVQDSIIQLKITEQQCYTNLISGPYKGEQEIKNKIILERQKNQESTEVPQNKYLKPANYQLLNQFNTKLEESCQCISFNKDNNILAVGCNYDIKIFTFNKGQLQFLTLLQGHGGSIKQILFTHNGEIISCSTDQTINIWSLQITSWYVIQVLKEHKNEVICMAINRTEDKLLSGGGDNQIKFWVKNKNTWICKQTLENHKYWVVSLSLNEKEDKLLSNGQDKKLNVFILDSDGFWSLYQVIEVQDFGYRASFIGDQIIAFQMQSKGLLQIYENTDLNSQFNLKKEISVKGANGCWYFFPQIYCKSLNILVNKHNKFINFIRIKQDGQYFVEQTIEFQTYDIYGTLSWDGQYLVVFNQKSKEIEIRKQL